MPVFFEEEGNMKNYRIKKNFRALAAVLGLSLVWGSAASAEPSADNGAKVEVSIVQNGGLLYDENRYEGKTPVPDGVNALADLPEKYDLRDEGRVTDVKFQNPWGACWAFGPIASLESNAITRGAQDPDYSEKALVWFAKNERKDEDAPDTELEGISVADGDTKEYVYNIGGSSWDVISALAAWQGASLESELPYRNAEGTTETVQLTEDGFAECYTADGDWSVDPSHAYDDAYRLEDSVCYLGFNSYAAAGYDGDQVWTTMFSSVYPAVKNWIMENGAISVGFCADYSSPDDLESGVTSEYYNWEHSAQYNPDSTSANHAVTIVGWDDSYPKENFSITPPGDGAWIVKNSWSDVWGENGYFYLSYYDTTVREYEGYLADVADSAGYYSYDNNYQYDYMGMGSLLNSSAETESIEKLGEINDSVSVANIFQAEGRETLRAVGVTDTRAWGESVEVVTEIYRLKDGSDPVNGELVSEQTDRIDNLLYTVVELDEPVELEEGEYFSVVQTMRLLTPGSETFLIPLEFGSEAPIYVQGYDAASSYYLNHTVLCGEGQSYIYFSTEEGKDPEWTDLGSEEAKEYFSIPLDDGTGTENSFTVGNAMIKAYTVDTDTTLSISNETLSLICYDGDGQEIKRIQDPDLTEEIHIPWNTSAVSIMLSEDSTSSLNISYGNETFPSGEKIGKDVFENAEGVVILKGNDRGEQASAEYGLKIVLDEEPADENDPSKDENNEGTGNGDSGDNIGEETPVEEEEDDLQNSGTGDESAGKIQTEEIQTGDQTQPILPAAAMVLSLIVIAGTTVVIRKRNN